MRRWIALSTLALAGATFVVLDVILGVTLWVSLLAAGCVLLAGGVATVAAGTTEAEAVRLNPIVDVRTLRARFGLVVALALAAAFLVVASFAFAASTVAVLGWTVGIGAAVLSLALSPTLRRAGRRQVISIPALRVRVAAWDVIAAAFALLSGWQIVQALVFSAPTARWLTFADACGLAGLALGALVLHELSTERVVHALELVEHAEATPAGRA